jgi:DNA-binding NarL/FixJ family response regulator
MLECISAMLEGEYSVYGVMPDRACILAEVEKSRPDVLILDISMGEISGIEVARALQRRSVTGKIVFLTVHIDQEFVKAAIDAGSSAYVVKSRAAWDLLPAIRAALRGRLFISSCVQGSLR